MTLLVSYVIHPELIKCGVSSTVAYIIDALIGIAVLCLLIFVLMPVLNDVFADDTAKKAGDVDPNSAPSGEGNQQKVAVFAAALFGAGYMAKRNKFF
jgi:hypothetical protein